MADRDREAAVDLASEFFVDFGPNDERWHDLFKDRMSAIVAKARAEGAASERAAATAACAAECNQRAAKYTATAIDLEKLGHVGTGEEVRLEARMARECESAIRALSPEGWVGVRRTDLSTLRESADVDAENLERLATDSTLAPEERERCASNATLIRAALARTET